MSQTLPHNKPQQAGEPSFLGVLIGGLFRLLFSLIRSTFRLAGVTIVWFAAFWNLGAYGPAWSPYAVLSLVCFVTFFAIAPHRFSRLKAFARKVAPIVGDHSRHETRKAKQLGRDMALWLKLATEESVETIAGEARKTETGTIVWDLGGLGIGWSEDKLRAHLLANVHVVGARGVEIFSVGTNSYRAVFLTEDAPKIAPLTFDPASPQPEAPHRVCIGLQQVFDLDSGYMLVPAMLSLTGAHTLLVGSSGSGKGSVLWSLVLGLVPQIENGSVKILGVDLKGGMEFGLGAALFEDTAYTLDRAEKLLDEMIEGLKQRQEQMLQAGLRSHQPTPENPLYLLLIDEAAAFQQLMDSKRLATFMGKLKMVLAQGRAAGYLVLAALQDPTKESFPARDLFTRHVVLRLRSEDQTRLALALGSGEEVPAAHAITMHEQGVGFMRDSETNETFKFRAFYVTDEQIIAAAADIQRTAAAIPVIE